MPCKSNEFNDPLVFLHQCSLPRLGTLGSQGGGGRDRLGGETGNKWVKQRLLLMVCLAHVLLR